MADVTATDISVRLKNIAAVIAGINAAYDDWPSADIGAASLPAIVVTVGDALSIRTESLFMRVQREYVLWLLVEKVIQDIAFVSSPARALFDPLQLLIAKTFATNSALTYNGQTLVHSVQVSALSKPAKVAGIHHDTQRDYWGGFVRLSITTIHDMS